MKRGYGTRFQGALDDVRIYAAALPPHEVRTLAAAGVAVCPLSVLQCMWTTFGLLYVPANESLCQERTTSQCYYGDPATVLYEVRLRGTRILGRYGSALEDAGRGFFLFQLDAECRAFRGCYDSVRAVPIEYCDEDTLPWHGEAVVAESARACRYSYPVLLKLADG